MYTCTERYKLIIKLFALDLQTNLYIPHQLIQPVTVFNYSLHLLFKASLSDQS